MTEATTIHAIIGYPTKPKGLRVWARANEDQWLDFYYGYRGRFEQDRKSKGRSTEADWFLVMSDESEIPLPSPEKIHELKQEIKTITQNFWSEALNIPA